MADVPSGVLAATLAKIEALLRAAGNRDLRTVEYAEGGVQLRIAFAGKGTADAPTPDQAPAPRLRSFENQGAGVVVSPGVGFLIASKHAGQPLPCEGDEVAAGAVVALVKAGPLLQPAVAPRSGRLGRCLVAEGAGVGFGAALFELI